MKEILPGNNGNFYRWLKGIPYEVSFWESYYSNKKRRKELIGWSQYNKECNLALFDIKEFINGCDSENPVILDVGSSISFIFGNIIDGIPREIKYVDPLASFYNEILKKYEIERPEIQYGMLEALSVFFDKNSVDFIHVRNALDHSANPLMGIIQSLIVLKKGGILYLNHFRNEAEKERYRGLHQYNITEDKGNLVIWNKEGSYNITDLCENFAEVETKVTDDGSIVSIITKTAEIPEKITEEFDANEYLANSKQKTLFFFNSRKNSFLFQWQRLYTRIIHKTMRLLPYSYIDKLKKLVN